MKISTALLGLAALSHGISAIALPDTDVATLDTRTQQPDLSPDADSSPAQELWKRKGGGGGGGRGGGGGGGGGGRGGGSSGGRGGSSGGSGSGSSGSRPGKGLGSSSSNAGGRTTTGSGPPPRFNGFYAGGATVPYRAGQSSGGIVPGLLLGSAIGLAAFDNVRYPYGAWSYPYQHPYFYHNDTTNKNETKPVVCMCGNFESCGCADNGNQTYFQSVVGNGSYQGLNRSIVDVAPNETTHAQTIYINGGLPNGTTAAGGSVSPNAAASLRDLGQTVYWLPVAAAGVTFAFAL